MEKFTETYITKRPISTDDVLVTCGASEAIDQLSFIFVIPKTK